MFNYHRKEMRDALPLTKCFENDRKDNPMLLKMIGSSQVTVGKRVSKYNFKRILNEICSLILFPTVAMTTQLTKIRYFTSK